MEAKAITLIRVPMQITASTFSLCIIRCAPRGSSYDPGTFHTIMSSSFTPAARHSFTAPSVKDETTLSFQRARTIPIFSPLPLPSKLFSASPVRVALSKSSFRYPLMLAGLRCFLIRGRRGGHGDITHRLQEVSIILHVILDSNILKQNIAWVVYWW
jgi:hypothetical protein